MSKPVIVHVHHGLQAIRRLVVAYGPKMKSARATPVNCASCRQSRGPALELYIAMAPLPRRQLTLAPTVSRWTAHCVRECSSGLHTFPRLPGEHAHLFSAVARGTCTLFRVCPGNTHIFLRYPLSREHTSSRIPPGFLQDSSRIPPGFLVGSASIFPSVGSASLFPSPRSASLFPSVGSASLFPSVAQFSSTTSAKSAQSCRDRHQRELLFFVLFAENVS